VDKKVLAQAWYLWVRWCSVEYKTELMGRMEGEWPKLIFSRVKAFLDKAEVDPLGSSGLGATMRSTRGSQTSRLHLDVGCQSETPRDMKEVPSWYPWERPSGNTSPGRIPGKVGNISPRALPWKLAFPSSPSTYVVPPLIRRSKSFTPPIDTNVQKDLWLLEKRRQETSRPSTYFHRRQSLIPIPPLPKEYRREKPKALELPSLAPVPEALPSSGHLKWAQPTATRAPLSVATWPSSNVYRQTKLDHFWAAKKRPIEEVSPTALVVSRPKLSENSPLWEVGPLAMEGLKMVGLDLAPSWFDILLNSSAGTPKADWYQHLLAKQEENLIEDYVVEDGSSVEMDDWELEDGSQDNHHVGEDFHMVGEV